MATPLDSVFVCSAASNRRGREQGKVRKREKWPYFKIQNVQAKWMFSAQRTEEEEEEDQVYFGFSCSCWLWTNGESTFVWEKPMNGSHENYWNTKYRISKHQQLVNILLLLAYIFWNDDAECLCFNIPKFMIMNMNLEGVGRISIFSLRDEMVLIRNFVTGFITSFLWVRWHCFYSESSIFGCFGEIHVNFTIAMPCHVHRIFFSMAG